MRIPTWLLVLLMGAGIILVVWLMINVAITGAKQPPRVRICVASTTLNPTEATHT